MSDSVVAPKTSGPVSDEALLASIGVGDRQAMQVLFGRHNVRIYRYVLRLVGDAGLAEDLVNEVFLEVWRHAKRFEGRSQVSTWLLGIARFKALSALRRSPTLPLDEEVAAAIPDPAANPEALLASKGTAAILRACIGQLSPIHREVVDLVYYHERSVKDVAEIVGIPAATVQTRMFYARKRLAGLLAAQGIEHAAA